MRELFLVRHAKSSWDYPDLRDEERPLGARGKSDAPFMARILLEKGFVPDKLVSSTARRAQDTASHFARVYQIDPRDVALVARVYEAMPDDLMEVVHGLSDEWGTVFLFGHNPGFTVFANRFAEGFRFDNVPTCGIVRILSEASSWQDVTPGQARVDSWYFPKEYRI
ncbi:MAG: histidine phosphatase family protein [Lewinellaceae bacterium]|nr:histidine phosphatase family protein [Saprospiraceae bacterium]MCB9311388.1 histidine phosphatase family protein [Lewinellaceae bacterium]